MSSKNINYDDPQLFPHAWMGSRDYPVCRHCNRIQPWLLVDKCVTCHGYKCQKNCPGGENLPCTDADVYI